MNSKFETLNKNKIARNSSSIDKEEIKEEEDSIYSSTPIRNYPNEEEPIPINLNSDILSNLRYRRSHRNPFIPHRRDTKEDRRDKENHRRRDRIEP